MTAFLLCSGAALLFVGGELLVRGAVRLALAFGTTRLIIALTVVAFGTSAPELAVSVLAGVRGNSDLAIGNVVGSNIFNVLFILGVSSLLVPLVVSRQVIRLDVPVMIGVSMLLLVFAFDRRLTPAGCHQPCCPLDRHPDHACSRWRLFPHLLHRLHHDARRGPALSRLLRALITYLVLDGSEHQALAEFRQIVLNIVLPVTVAPLPALMLRSWLLRRRPPE